MSLKKLAGWAAFVFIAWYVFTQPTAAGNAVHSLLGTAQQAAASLTTFIGTW